MLYDKKLIATLSVTDNDGNHGEWLIGKLFLDTDGIYDMQLGLWGSVSGKYLYVVKDDGGSSAIDIYTAIVESITDLYASILKTSSTDAWSHVKPISESFRQANVMSNINPYDALVYFINEVIAPNWNNTTSNTFTYINDTDL